MLFSLAEIYASVSYNSFHSGYCCATLARTFASSGPENEASTRSLPRGEVLPARH